MAPYTVVVSIVPFVFILSVTAIKEAVEDYIRHREDSRTNSAEYEHLEGSVFDKYTSGDIHVGDILIIRENQPFPADLLLVSSSESNGLAFIDTANLDGETK